MQILTVRTVKRFDKHYRKLSKQIRDQAKEKERIFRDDPFNAILRTHKLHGKDRDSFAFWINNSYRIKFVFITQCEVLFLDIGTHDIYS